MNGPIPTRSPRRGLHLLFALCALACGARPASALELCVQTLGDLLAGLDQAGQFQSDLSGTVTLRLVAQTYGYTGFRQITQVNRLNLLGGYNADCTARTVDAANTVIDGLAQMDLQLRHGGLGVTIEGVRFRNMKQLLVYDIGTCADYGRIVTMRRSMVDTDTSAAQAGFSLSSACGNVVFENNLVRSRGGVTLGSSPAVFASEVYATNNTIVQSQHAGLQLYRGPDSQAVGFHLSNNVLWNNAGEDVALAANSWLPTVHARHNLWQGTPLLQLATSAGNLVADPLLGANGRPAEPASPAINSGLNTPPGGLPGVDLDGGPRIVGSAVDRGAYESAVVDIADLVVTTAADSGAGSLRQAIIDANSHPNASTVRFAIPGPNGAILVPGTPYPDVLAPLRIDGFSQAGAQPNTSEWSNNASYRIFIQRSQRISHAFRVPASAAASVSLQLDGLVLGGFDNAIVLQGGSGHAIRGSHLGSGFADFLDVPGNLNNIAVGGSAHAVSIGGFAPADRNSIAGADDIGISLAGSGIQHLVVNNLIGTARNGNEARGNGTGIRLATDHSAVIDNLISGNTVGLDVRGSNAIVSANRIGLKAFSICLPPCTPNHALPNGDGVRFAATALDNLVTGNTVAYNSALGVVLAAGATGNRFSSNLAYQNGLRDFDLLQPAGMNPIDSDVPLVTPGGCGNANCDQNFPALAAAAGTRNAGRVAGTLSTWNGVHRLEFFAGPSCGAGGQAGARRYLGSAQMTVAGGTLLPPVNGSAPFDLPIQSTQSLYGTWITATATSPSGNTSEYAACVAYACDRIFAYGLDTDAAEVCPPID